MNEWWLYGISHIHTCTCMYLINAASDKNLFCSSTVAPFFNVFTATGVGPVLCPKISIAVPW